MTQRQPWWLLAPTRKLWPATEAQSLSLTTDSSKFSGTKIKIKIGWVLIKLVFYISWDCKFCGFNLFVYFEYVFQEKSEGADDQQQDHRSVKERLGPPIIPHPSKLSLNNMKPKTVEQPVPAEKVFILYNIKEKVPIYLWSLVVSTCTCKVKYL